MNKYDHTLRIINDALEEIEMRLEAANYGDATQLKLESKLISLENKLFMFQGDLITAYTSLVEDFQKSELFIPCIHAYLLESHPETSWTIIPDFPNICQEINGERSKPYQYHITMRPVICSKSANAQMEKNFFGKKTVIGKKALQCDLAKLTGPNFTLSSVQPVQFEMEKIYKNLRKQKELFTFNHDSTNQKDYYDGCNVSMESTEDGKVYLVVDRSYEINIADTNHASQIFDDYITMHQESETSLIQNVEKAIKDYESLPGKVIFPHVDKTSLRASEEANY